METANTVGVPKSSAITVIVICIIIYLIIYITAWFILHDIGCRGGRGVLQNARIMIASLMCAMRRSWRAFCKTPLLIVRVPLALVTVMRYAPRGGHICPP